MNNEESTKILYDIEQKHIIQDINELKEKVKDHDNRLNKNDIVMATMSQDIKAIKKIVTKLDEREEQKKIENEKDIKEFKKKIFYFIFGVIAAIVISALGIKKLM